MAQGYIYDGKKQTLTSGPYPLQSHIAVFDTQAELEGLKAVKGSFVYALDQNRFYIYTGTAWRRTAATGTFSF